MRALIAIGALLVMGLPAPAQATHGNCVVDLSPETDSNVLGQTHTITATLRPAGTDVNGTSTATCADHKQVTINFEVTGQSGATYSPSGIDAASTGTNDLSCSLKPNQNSCTISYSRTAVTGTDSIVGSTGDTPTVSDTVSKTWTAAAPAFLNVTPETDTNPLGSDHALTATVRSSSGALSSGVVVDFEVIDGPNENTDGDADEPDLSCTTASNGTCSVDYEDEEASSGEIDTICAWLDTDSDDVFDEDGSNADGGDCDSETAGESEESSVTGTDTFGNDVTDKVTKTWSSTAAGTAIYLNVSPETDTNPLGTTHTFTAIARDENGNLVSGTVIDFEVTDGPNQDLDADDDSPDRTCTTGSNGSCTASYVDDDADSGETDVICAWLDTDNDDVLDLDGSDPDGGDCDSETQTETEDSARSGTDTFGNDETDEVTKSWGATTGGPAVLLNLNPETEENPLRAEHTLTATARNATGNLVSGAQIDFEVVDGPNADLDDGDPDLDCTTGSSGTCSVSYEDASASVGDQDEICAWIDTDSDDVYDDDGADEDGGDCDEEDDGESEDSSVSGTDVYGNDVTDVVTKDWVASADAFYLNVNPENAVNAPGTEHTITAVAHDREGNLSVGVSIDFEVLRGPNANLDNLSADSDLECITNSAGTCSVSYNDASGAEEASNNVDTICAWLDIEDDDDLALAGSISDGGACDEEVVGEPEDSGVAGRDEFGNDATDTVSKTWTSQQLPAACRVEGAIIGTDQAETLLGTPGNDVICALGGADSILGYGGDDLILSGGGPDNIRGGGGADRIRTGRSDDVAVGQKGTDDIRGRAGDDYLLGSSSSDTLRGGIGSDVLDGGRAFDVCRGGPGRDRRIRCEG